MSDNDEELDAAEPEDAAEGEPETDEPSNDLGEGLDVASVRIRPQALPYYVFVEIPREPLDLRCRQYYRQHRNELELEVRYLAEDLGRSPRERKMVADTLRAYRHGRLPQAMIEQFLGKDKVYWPILRAILRREIQRQHQDREVQLFQDADLQHDDPQNYGLACYFFFVPTITLPDTAQELPVVDVVVRTAEEIDAQVTRKIDAASLVQVLTEEKAEPCGPGDGVVASLVASQGGRKIDYLDLRNHTFFTGQPSQSIPDSLFLGLAAGERRTGRIPSPPGAPGVEPGEIDLHVHVHGVYGTRSTTPDEQAAARGFANAVEWRARLTAAHAAKQQDTRRSAIRAAIERRLREIAEIGAVPNSWLTTKIMESYGQLLRQHGSEAATLTALHAADKEELLNALNLRLLIDLEQTLLVREWGRLVGVEGDSSFENATNYVAAVWAWAEQHVSVNEISTATIEEQRMRAMPSG